MSDEAKTDPPPDPLLAILSELTSASERQTSALGTIARDVQTAIANIDLARQEIANLRKRVGPLELEVDHLREGAGSNGANGHA